MNIRYKQKGIALKFTGDNFDEFLEEIPNLKSIVEADFSSVEQWIEASKNSEGILLRHDEGVWILVKKGLYFISIEGLDLAVSEENFKEDFEEIEETV